ncbi:MAG: hypothetical protein JW966_05285, partial [Anaerolineae bacterium]|nr:hypothetical protein [Anaerolineae bacterium]
MGYEAACSCFFRLWDHQIGKNSKQSGCGPGLVIAQEIVYAHGKSMFVQRTTGKRKLFLVLSSILCKWLFVIKSENGLQNGSPT